MTYVVRVGGAKQEILTDPSQTTFTMPLGTSFDDQTALDFSIDDGDLTRRSYYRVTVPGQRARKERFTDLVFTQTGRTVAVSSTTGEVAHIENPGAFYSDLFDAARQDVATYWEILGVSEKTDQIDSITAGRAVLYTFYSDQPDVLPIITATETEIRSLWDSVAKLDVTLDLSGVAVSIDAAPPARLPTRVALAPGPHEFVVKLDGTPVRSESVVVDSSTPRRVSLPLVGARRTVPALSANTKVRGSADHATVGAGGEPGKNRAILVTVGLVLVIVILSFIFGGIFFGCCIPAARLRPGPARASSRGGDPGDGADAGAVHARPVTSAPGGGSGE